MIVNTHHHIFHGTFAKNLMLRAGGCAPQMRVQVHTYRKIIVLYITSHIKYIIIAEMRGEMTICHEISNNSIRLFIKTEI